MLSSIVRSKADLTIDQPNNYKINRKFKFVENIVSGLSAISVRNPALNSIIYASQI